LKIEPIRCSIAISGNQGDEGRQQRRRLQRSAQRDPCRRDNTSGKARAERGGRSLSRPAKRGPGGASTGAGAFQGVLAVFCAAATLLPWSLPAAPSAHWAIGPANNSPSCSAGAVNEISFPSDCARSLVSQCSVRAPRGRTRPRHHGRPHVEACVSERTLRGAAADQAVILTLLGLRVRGGRAVRACHRSYPGLFSPSLLPLFAPFVSDVFLCVPFGSVARRGCLAATASCLLVQPSSVRMAGSEPHERLCRLHGPPAGVGGTASFEATTRSRPGKNLLRHAILKWIQVFLFVGASASGSRSPAAVLHLCAAVGPLGQDLRPLGWRGSLRLRLVF
jgi:hypothetical protein